MWGISHRDTGLVVQNPTRSLQGMDCFSSVELIYFEPLNLDVIMKQLLAWQELLNLTVELDKTE